MGRIWAHLQSRPEGKGNHQAFDGDRTEASLVLTTVHLQTRLVWKAASTGQRMPFSRPRLERTYGPDRRGGHSWPPLALACPLWLWCGHCSDLIGLWQSHTVGAWGCGKRGMMWAWMGEAWPSQLLLVAVQGLDQRPCCLGTTY